MNSPRLPSSRRSSAFSCLLALSAAAFTPAVIQAQTIFIDFGGGGSSETALTGWNNVTGVGVMGSAASLLAITGSASGITYQITDAFQATNGQGDQLEIGEFPISASRDSFYGSNDNALGQITFAGFDPTKQYTFTFLSSRDSVSAGRMTLFTVSGASSSSVEVNSSVATPTPGSIFSITPSLAGTFVLNVTVGPNNANNNDGFFYLNAMKIEAVSAIPEPSAAAVLAGAAAVTLVGLRRRRD